MRIHNIVRYSYWISVVMIIICLAWITPAKASNNPRLIPFQGRLIDGEGKEIHGVYRITFAIYDKPTGGSPLWSEVHESVSVINGQVNALLGSMSNLDDPDNNDDLSDSVYFTSSRFLGIKVGEESNQEMVPRQQLVPSFHARTADHAVEADHAKEADHAAEADHAKEAEHSVLATKAGDADNLDGYDSNYFIFQLVPKGAIIMWSGSISNIPAGWILCDGTNGTPDLRDRFILGTTSGENPGATGGAHNTNLSVANLPSHTHSIVGNTGVQSNDHSHSGTTSVAGEHGHTLKWEYGPEGMGAPEQGSWLYSSVYSADIQTGMAGNHSHTFTTGGISQNHTHPISFTSGSTGSGSPVDNRPAFYKLAFIMKL